MAKRTVVWTETAAGQRREVLRYWTKHNDSSNYAEKLIKVTASQIQIILGHPESFKSTSYAGTRESAMGHFSIYYKLTKDKLIITAFWDNRQDPKALLEIVEQYRK
ncbi:MAG: type II toxin-antitoxin system RelE/ParE family toxin [Bacteroidia bacterium]|nr:type II toxin-antitoxin system RelE/ParE family toxin [Bacteroidia bacterium]